MKCRKLRIAWSVVCALVCVLLIALWVRSYWKWDTLASRLPTGSNLVLTSCDGDFSVGIDNQPGPFAYTEALEVESRLTSSWTRDDSERGFGIHRGPTYLIVASPAWFWVVVGVLLSGAPWIRKRFSVRTRLIATTLVALGLGVIVCGCGDSSPRQSTALACPLVSGIIGSLLIRAGGHTSRCDCRPSCCCTTGIVIRFVPFFFVTRLLATIMPSEGRDALLNKIVDANERIVGAKERLVQAIPSLELEQLEDVLRLLQQHSTELWAKLTEFGH